MAYRTIFWAGFWAFLLDQVSKYLVVHMMELSRVGRIDVLPPFLTFRYGENRGVNFGLFNGNSETQRWALIVFSLVVMAVVFFWVYRAAAPRLVLISAGLLIGGALGNVMDRVLYGYVLDFLNMSCCGINNPFVFNVGDVFIFLGAAGLVFLDAGERGKKPS